MKGKNILVTGGAGFIGSNLCKRLFDLGNNVVSIDNYFTGSKKNHVEGVNYLRVNTFDLNHTITEQIVHEILKSDKLDLIFHLGEYSRVEQSFDDQEFVFNFNIQGTKKVFDLAVKTRAKLIYAGSSTKFADKTDGYVQSPYAWTKKTNTDLIQRYHDWKSLDYATVYFYNAYGKNEINSTRYATLIAKYAEHMRMGKPLPIVLPGTQQRNFTHVDDIVDALILVGNYGKGDEYGIGNETAYSVQDIATLFGGELNYLPERLGNRMSAPLITEKTKALGWKATRNLEDYIKQLRENDWKHL